MWLMCRWLSLAGLLATTLGAAARQRSCHRTTMSDLGYTRLYQADAAIHHTSKTDRQYHIDKLIDILFYSAHAGDIARAKRAWTILLRCKEFDWKSNWTVGILLLHEREDGSDNSEVVFNYIRRFMLSQKTDVSGKISVFLVKVVRSRDTHAERRYFERTDLANSKDRRLSTCIRRARVVSVLSMPKSSF